MYQPVGNYLRKEREKKGTYAQYFPVPQVTNCNKITIYTGNSIHEQVLVPLLGIMISETAFITMIVSSETLSSLPILLNPRLSHRRIFRRLPLPGNPLLPRTLRRPKANNAIRLFLVLSLRLSLNAALAWTGFRTLRNHVRGHDRKRILIFTYRGFQFLASFTGADFFHSPNPF